MRVGAFVCVCRNQMASPVSMCVSEERLTDTVRRLRLRCHAHSRPLCLDTRDCKGWILNDNACYKRKRKKFFFCLYLVVVTGLKNESINVQTV